MFCLRFHFYFFYSFLLFNRYSRNVRQTDIDDNFKKTVIVKVVAEPSHDPKLSFLKRRSGDKHYTYVLVVYEAIMNSTQPWLEKLLRKYSFEYNIFNMATIFLLNAESHQNNNRSNEFELNMYTYSPYDERTVHFNNSIYLKEDLFYDKTLNFYGKPFRVSLFPEEVRAVMKGPNEIYGLDAFMVELLTRKLNASLVLLPSPDKEEYGNPTAPNNASGTLGQVVREEVDIQLNSRFLRLDLFYNNNIAEPTRTIGRDDMCILVPKSGYVPTLVTFFNSLKLSIWILILVIIIPFTIAFRAFAKYEWKNSRSDGYCTKVHYFDMVRFYFNQVLPKVPDTLKLRVIIIHWIFYCFLITNIFQSCLTTSFTVKNLEKEINTIDDMSKSDYQIIAAIDYAKLIKRYLNVTTGVNRTELTDKLLPMEWFQYNQFIGNNNINYAYANKHHMINYYANVKLQNNIPLYHAARECPVPFLACYILPFGSPLLKRINNIIGRLENAGIFRYWERKMKADDVAIHLERTEGTPERLGFDKMFAFYFLLFGWAISFLAFLGEYFFTANIKNLLNSVDRKLYCNV